MKVAALVAAILVFGPPGAGPVRAADPPPFERIALPEQKKHHHLGSYLTMAAGLGLMVAAFPLRDKADESYDQYLTSTDPDEMEQLYHQAARYDDLATASMLTGEAALVLGIYLRFLREPAPGRLGLTCDFDRVGLSLRF